MLIKKYLVMSIGYNDMIVTGVQDMNKGMYQDEFTILNTNIQLMKTIGSLVNPIGIPYRSKSDALKYIEELLLSGQNDYNSQYYTVIPTYMYTYDIKEIRYYKLKKLKKNICKE